MTRIDSGRTNECRERIVPKQLFRPGAEGWGLRVHINCVLGLQLCQDKLFLPLLGAG